MESRLVRRYVDRGFGFPVILKDVDLVKVRGKWTPHIDYNHLARAVLQQLAISSGRLTGSQIKFIRLHFEMTLQQFAARFGVTHPAVLRWERIGSKPTEMSWSTEKDIRLFIDQRLQRKPTSLFALYTQLESAASSRPATVSVDVEKIAA